MHPIRQRASPAVGFLFRRPGAPGVAWFLRLAFAITILTIPLRPTSAAAIQLKPIGRSSFTDVHSMVYSPMGNLMAVRAYISGQGLHTQVLDVRTGGAVVMFAGATSEAVFSLDERTLIASGPVTDDHISIWDVESGHQTARLEGRGAYLALSPDGDTVAGVVEGLGEDGEVVPGTGRDIALWSIAAGRRVAVLGSHRWVRDLAYSPDGGILASGGEDDVIRLWDIAARREIATLVGHTDGIQCLAFSPDGSILASGSDDYTVKLWDVATRQEIATLAGHARPVYSVAFSSDGSTLASGGGDYAVRLWDVASAREKAVLRGHERIVVMVAFSHEEGRLLSGSNLQWSEDWRMFGDVIRVWDPASQQQVDSFGSVLPSVNSL